MASAGNSLDLGHARVVLGLELEGGLGDRQRDRVVVLPRDDQQRTADSGFLESTRVSLTGLKFDTAA